MNPSTQPMPVLFTPRPGLCACGQPAPGAWRALAHAGIRTVVNLRPDDELPDRDEATEVAEAGMNYVHIPVRDANDLCRSAAERLHQVLVQSPSTVLVHCGTANRAGALIALADAWCGSGQVENALAMGRDAGMVGLEPAVRALLRCSDA